MTLIEKAKHEKYHTSIRYAIHMMNKENQDKHLVEIGKINLELAKKTIDTMTISNERLAGILQLLNL